MSDFQLWLLCVTGGFVLLIATPRLVLAWAEKALSRQDDEGVIRDCSNWNETWETLR